jgi:hypothetical protein
LEDFFYKINREIFFGKLSLYKILITMKLYILLAILFTELFFFGQDKIIMDKESIKSMCGCFNVGFHFAETFSYSNDTNYTPSKEKHAGATEWAQLVEETDTSVVIQHLLVVGSGENSMIIKHWRQDWIYENTEFYIYDLDNKWSFQKLQSDNVKGQWTQKVFQVDDSPRYEGSGSWVYVDGKKYWESTTNAPLPRREYTIRSDYNLTARTSRHEIVENGWIHDQDNKKIVRENGKEDFVLAEEKGMNIYKRLEDSKCKAAKDWWLENSEYWQNVRSVWSDIYSRNEDLELENKFEGKKLYSVLFNMDIKSSNKKIRKAIVPYVKSKS